ncbi:hypothetical protein J3Q64DRAFT_1630928 [Phycomyces blakesleeanus]|uniref:Bromo domain-containing protein n=1 Tax=Phycomyces blakesleeanus TaxID=4837 RepID=A0ABR3BCS8_PHYBL
MATTDWSILEKLLLAQAVYKFGEDNWVQIARNLKHHAMLQRQPEFFNQKNCSLQYYLLVEDLEAERRLSKAGPIQDMPSVVKLARQLYMQRMDELKSAIKKDEEEFIRLVSEIDDIKAGRWDSRLVDLVKENQQKDSAGVTIKMEIPNATERGKDDQRQKSWQKNISLLWREIANHKNGAMFMNPIKEATAPLYYDILIKTTVEFERDVVLMLTNSLMYNKEGTEVYQMALEMLEDATEQINIFKMADTTSSACAHIRKASIVTKDQRKSIAE